MPYLDNKDTSVKLTIRENVVSDDTIEVCYKGYKFDRKGKACQVKVVYNTYANEWSDTPHYIYATSISKALDRYDKVKHMSEEERTAVEAFFYNEPLDLYNVEALA